MLSFNQDSLGIAMYVRGGGNSAGRGVMIQGELIVTGSNFAWPSASCRCPRTMECIDPQMERLLSARAYQIDGDTLFILGN
ncbi:MAG: hypothetical protein IPP40_13155 [bacterium]|nr:hypothetical protein [bacterium]